MKPSFPTASNASAINFSITAFPFADIQAHEACNEFEGSSRRLRMVETVITWIHEGYVMSRDFDLRLMASL
jgi:hypothetical protein